MIKLILIILTLGGYYKCTTISTLTKNELNTKLILTQKEIKQENFTRALDYLFELLKVKPENRILHVNVAWCYFKLREYRLAIKHADAALHSNQIFSRAIRIKANSLVILGNMALFENNYTEAEANFKQALELRPKKKVISAYLAFLYMITERFEEAASFALVALKQDSHFKLARTVYAISLHRLGQIELYKKKNYDKALGLINHSLEIRPRNMQAHTDLAYAHLKKKNFTECISNADKALEYDTNNFKTKHFKSICLLNLSTVYLDQKDYSLFLFYLKKAFSLAAADTATYAKYSRVLLNLKYYDEAFDLAKRALALDASNQIAQQVKLEAYSCLYKGWNYYSIYC